MSIRFPKFLAPEFFPYTRVEVMHADGRVTVIYARPVPAVVEPAIVPVDTTSGIAVPVVDVQARAEAGRCRMSRYGSDGDVDTLDTLTAICDDCGAAFFTRDDDPAFWCDPCGDRRDRHTAGLERRLTDVALAMVQAALAKTERVA